MRIHPALALAAALLPALAAAQTDEWVRDNMSDESLWLLRTGNLAREAPRAGTLPGAPDDSSHWVMSKGDGPAYVVYFIPGRIHEVEIDTHRLAGATGDFSLAVSTDGKLYQPLDTGAVLLDTSFGWDYRLMASDQIPENATHLLVQFPEGSTAHSLSEVWIRYTWDDALISRFLPEPVAAPRPQAALAAQSDAELQAMLDFLMNQAAPPPAPNLVENAAPVPFAEPEVAEDMTAPVVIEEAPADSIVPDAEVGEVAVDVSDSAPAAADSSVAIAPPESEPVNEISLSVDAPDDATTPPTSATAPVELANVEAPVDIAPETEAPTAASESASEVAVSPSETLSPDDPRETDATEEVHVLPAFTLPVFVSDEASDAPPPPQFESPPPATADSVVLEPAPPAIVPPPAGAALQEPQAPPQDSPQDPSPASMPAQIAPLAPAESNRRAEIAPDDEPTAKPAMKMRRFGPRSKSRGTLVARD